MSDGGDVSGDIGRVDWESAPDLTSVPRQELGAMLEQLVEQEREISYRRRVLQGRIDLIRSELVRRGEASLSPEELARVLMDKGGEGPTV